MKGATLLLPFFLLASANLLAQRTTLIQNVRIADGSGGPLFRGAVRIQDSVIIATGALLPLPTDSIIDGSGLVLAPGLSTRTVIISATTMKILRHWPPTARALPPL
jgi:hypothetical protein